MLHTFLPALGSTFPKECGKRAKPHEFHRCTGTAASSALTALASHRRHSASVSSPAKAAPSCLRASSTKTLKPLRSICSSHPRSIIFLGSCPSPKHFMVCPKAHKLLHGGTQQMPQTILSRRSIVPKLLIHFTGKSHAVLNLDAESSRQTHPVSEKTEGATSLSPRSA
jgi:hypothetical protein